jgi:tetratricopeptide (TPR) repeat protein
VELGLFDEASEKLTFVMKVSDDPAVRSLSAYCLGICLLSMAKRDSQDGKAGAAFLHLQQGIDSCRQLGRHLGCVHKLLGDLYSFGAVLPLDIFSEDTVYVPDERNVVQEELMVRRQLAFVAEGKISYEAAETLLRGSDEEELLVMRASAATDVGSNLLLQAQIVSFWQNKGIDEVAPPEAEHLLEQAEREFRRAIGICPVYAPAWCGLGCAVHKFDPILAQHAFCRSIQLDPLFPDPYASLGFLYTRCGAAQASTSVSMALTQVADTPMMWINRALLLERQEGSLESARAPSIPGGSAHRYEQAADAYRAALQVAPLPSAKLGLALTCRRRRQQQQLLPQPLPRSWSPASINDDPISRAESHCLLREYLDATGRLDVASRVFGGVAACESGSAPALGGTSSSSSATISDRLLDEGRREILVGLDRLEGFSVEDEERDGDLNLESIRTLLSRYPAVPSETSAPFAEATTTTAAAAAAAAKIGFDPNVGLAKRRVYLEPERGDLWLALANDLVRSLPVSWDPAAADSAGREEEEKDATALRDARVAAHRACDLLEGRSRDPSLRRDPRHPHRGPSPSAREVSEALALRCWLDSVAAATATGLPSGSKGGRFRITVDAQRALLLCPDNAVAREILMAQQGISS